MDNGALVCISVVKLGIVPAETLLQSYTVKHTRNFHFILQAQIEQSQAEQWNYVIYLFTHMHVRHMNKKQIRQI